MAMRWRSESDGSIAFAVGVASNYAVRRNRKGGWIAGAFDGRSGKLIGKADVADQDAGKAWAQDFEDRRRV